MSLKADIFREIHAALAIRPGLEVRCEEYLDYMTFEGGIDKHVLRRSQAEIVAELEYKIPPLVRFGGCMLGLGHRLLNGTPLANYRFYVAKAWALMERASV